MVVSVLVTGLVTFEDIKDGGKKDYKNPNLSPVCLSDKDVNVRFTNVS